MAKTFIQRNLFLIVTSLITTILGLCNAVWLPKVAGVEVLGLTALVQPTLLTITSITLLGIPVAMTKFIAERLAYEDEPGAQRILRIGTALVVGINLIAGLFLFFGSTFLAASLRSHQSSIVLSDLSTLFQLGAVLLLIQSLGAAYSAYFSGAQKVEPIGYTQVAVQISHILFTILIILGLRYYGFGTAGLSAGVLVSEIAAGLVGTLLFYFWYRTRYGHRVKPLPPRPAANPDVPALPSSRKIIFQMVKYSLPITLIPFVNSLAASLQTWLIPRLLQGTQVLTELGIYSRNQMLAGNITFIVPILTITLFPVIASYLARKQTNALQYKIQRAWTLALAGSLPLAAILIVLGPALLTTFFSHSQGSTTLILLALTMVVVSLKMTGVTILQALNHTHAPLFFSLVALVANGLGNLLLIPYTQSLVGAAWAGLISILLSCSLTLYYTKRVTATPFSGRRVLLHPLLCTLGMGGVMQTGLWLLARFTPFSSLATPLQLAFLLLLVLFGGLTYLILSVRLRVIQEQDLASLPWIQSWLQHFVPGRPRVGS